LVETRTSGVPQPPPHELKRERLLTVLHRHRAQPLIMLVAPAGFGKSTLAATYARDSGGAVAWLTLQSADRDTRRLFRRLAAALEAGFGEPGSVPALRAGLEEGGDGIGLARRLLDDLTQAPAGLITVLDDFHLVDDSPDVIEAIDDLIRELPTETGQIVITSRSAPPLSMTRLVADGSVFALGTDDLRFTPDETRELRKLLRAASVDPPDPQREAEEDERDTRAEGWIAGILLGGAPRELNIGGGTLLGSYVEREVLNRLPPDEQNWLEMLSVFDSITPHAAERMFGEGNWPARLLALTERCPFLVAGQDGAYSLHGFVRDTALNRLRRGPSERFRAAWTVASELADEAGDPVAVVRACQELGQIEGAVEVVRRAALDSVRIGRWNAVLVTLQLLPEVVRRANPELSLLEARALLNTGHPERAHEAAEAALQFGGRSGEVEVQIRALIELASIGLSSDIAAVDVWLSAAEHLLHTQHFTQETERLLHGRTLEVRGMFATERGDIKAAREAFETGERLLNLLGPSRELALIQQNYGTFCTRSGDYARAEEALYAAAAYWRLVGDKNGLATTETVLGEVHLRMGTPEAAGSELNDALTAARAIGARRMEAYTTMALGLWHRASGRLREAIANFDDGLALADDVGERELLADTLVFRAEVALLCNDLAAARQLLAQAQAESQRLGANRTMASVDRALGRLHLLDGAGDRAVSHLQAALKRAGEAWGPDQRAETLYWLGTAHLHLGWAQQATACLEQAISLLAPEGQAALLAGPAAEDSRLLEHGRQVGLSPVFLAEVERLSATRKPWTGVTTPHAHVVVKNELPRIEVQLFGSFVLYRDGQLVSNAARKVDRMRELAAILILNPKGLSDDAIAESMFPDMERERALHNLQMSASMLRSRLLGSKAAVRYSARMYQLNPQIELIADVRDFDSALARARGATGDQLIQALTSAIELYRGPLLADAAWDWLEPVRLEYRSRYVTAALHLADAFAPLDVDRSDGLAEAVLTVAPETDMAYERLMQNARQRRDQNALRRLGKRYQQAAAQFGFTVNPHLGDENGATLTRAAR
jgi:ATP/maltotriose-dependent transcriptional regulator MalT/DNA-binding SARP family transcriptional activator